MTTASHHHHPPLMTMKNLKIGAKMALGFGAVILIACLLGGLAIWQMTGVSGQYRILAQQYLPASNQARDLSDAMLQTMYGVRGYALSEKEDYLQEANLHMASFKNALPAAMELAKQNAQLAGLAPLLTAAGTNFAAYEKLVTETTLCNRRIVALRKRQDEAGTLVARLVDEMQQAQEALWRQEAATNAAIAILNQRVNKLVLLGEIQEHAYAIRLGNVKFQLFGDTNFAAGVMPKFALIQSNLNALKPLMLQVANLVALDKAAQAVGGYEQSMQEVMADWLNLQRLNEDRSRIGMAIHQSLSQVHEFTQTHTAGIAGETTRQLVSASRIIGSGLLAVLVFSVLVAIYQTRTITGGIVKAVHYATEIAQGNLSFRIQMDQKDELGELALALNRMGDGFREQITRIRETASTLGNLTSTIDGAVSLLASASAQIATTTSEVVAAASETAAAVSETSTTIEEVNQTVRNSSDRAKSVSEASNAMDQIAQSGRKTVEASILGMNRIQTQMSSIGETIVQLSEQSQAIGEIIASVSDLAEQSNLLAVNAAIEAAKAGEQGKGFAVVAQEVRNLAEQSKQATVQVRGILNDIQKAISAAVMATEQGSKIVESGVSQSGEVSQTIKVLADNANSSAQSAAQISLSLQQLHTGMDQVSSAMENIRVASQQNVIGVKQTEKASISLRGLGEDLSRLVQQNKELGHKLTSLVSNYKV